MLKAQDVDDYSTYSIDITTNDKHAFKGKQGETRNNNIYFLDTSDNDCAIKVSFDNKGILHVGQVKCFDQRAIYDFFTGEYIFVKNIEKTKPSAEKKVIDSKVIKVVVDPNIYGKASVTVDGEDWFPILPVSSGLISNSDYEKLIALGTSLEGKKCKIVLFNNGKGWAIIGFGCDMQSFTATIVSDANGLDRIIVHDKNEISSTGYVRDDSIEKRIVLKKNISLAGVVKYYPGTPGSGDIPNYILKVSNTEGHIICFCGSNNFKLGCSAFSDFENNLDKKISIIGDYLKIENEEGSYECINLMTNR